MTKTISPRQYAKRLGVCPQKVCKWIDAGEIRAINVVANPHTSPPRWRITEDEIARFERHRMSEAAQ